MVFQVGRFVAFWTIYRFFQLLAVLKLFKGKRKKIIIISDRLIVLNWKKSFKKNIASRWIEKKVLKKYCLAKFSVQIFIAKRIEKSKQCLWTYWYWILNSYLFINGTQWFWYYVLNNKIVLINSIGKLYNRKNTVRS